MFLRFLLIGAVVAMGSETAPPAGSDFARWATGAQSWCNARIQHLANLSRASAAPAPAPIVAEPSPAPAPTALAVASPDAAFERAMAGNIATFVADLAPTPGNPTAPLLVAAEPATQPLPPAATEVEPTEPDTFGDAAQLVAAEEALAQPAPLHIETTSTLGAELQSCDAFAAGQLALSAPEPPAAVAAVAIAEPPADRPASEPAPDAFPSGTSESSFAAEEADRAERLNSAVRLTGEAVRAWARLLNTPHVAYHDRAGIFSR